MKTLHTFETSVSGLKNIDGIETDVNYNFVGEVYDEPCASTVENGDFFTKISIHECSDKGAKKIGQLVYPTMDQSELEELINGLVKNIDKTLKCL